MTKTIGVIGLGSIGMRHAKNLVDMGHQVRGYDPDWKRAIELMKYSKDKRFLPSTCTEPDGVIKDSNGIVIASPTNLHVKYIRDSFNLNSIGVFVEKPIADRLDDEIDWVDMVGYNLRFHSCVKKAKEWINQGFLGYPQWANFVCAQYNDRPRYLSDGVILNWSHEIDLALYFLGPATVEASATLCNPLDTMTDIVLRHKESGCRSVIHLDYLTQPEVRQSIIVGSDATIIMDLVNRQAWVRLLSGMVADHFIGHDSWDDNYNEEMSAFIDRIDGKTTLGCTGTEALETLKICLQVRKQAGL